MSLDFTNIKWAGDDCILITEREHAREPILILDSGDIKRLIETWKEKKR